MAIVRDKTKNLIIHTDVNDAGQDLSAAARQYTVVDLTAAGVVNVAGQGADFYGVLMNTPGDGETAIVAINGTIEIRAASAIAKGDEVTCAGVGGTIETAAGADYVVGTAREAGIEDQCVSVVLRKYQKNA